MYHIKYTNTRFLSNIILINVNSTIPMCLHRLTHTSDNSKTNQLIPPYAYAFSAISNAQQPVNNIRM